MKNKLHFVSLDLLSSKFNKTKLNRQRKFTIQFVFSLFILSLLMVKTSQAQQPVTIADFVLYSGNGSGSGATSPVAPGAGVLVGCNSVVNGAAIGSQKLIQSTGPATLSSNLISNGTVDLASNCILTGKISAANSAALTGTVVSVGTASSLGGNIDANGNISVAGGSVFGKVTHPVGTTYTGPTPSGGNVTASPTLLTLPTMPAILTFPASTLTAVNNTSTINPGSYGNMTLSGLKTLTLNGPGDYIFNSVSNQSDNNLIFNFNNSVSGVFRIFIHGDADFGQIHASMINGGSAARIYTEVHGNGISSSNGTYSFVIANCTAAIKSSWLGTVWAPYAAIKIGSLSGGTDITGALWSGTQVNVRCGVTINSAPYNVTACTTPNANAGADKQLNCTTTSIQLNGSSTTANVSYSWVASNGGNIVSGAATAAPTVNAAGTYTLTVTTNSGACTATDVALVTSNTSTPNANAGADKQLSCSILSTQLNGTSTSTGVTYKWLASNGGNIVSGSTTATPTVNAAGTYTLVVTQTSNGCTATDQAVVTNNGGVIPNANAGPDKVLTCSTTSLQLSGSSTTSSVSYNWVASNGGNIVNGASTATPTVNAAGTYTLTVTALAGGCTKTDVALVSSTTTLPNANAGADKVLTCSTTSLQLNGSSTTSGVSYLWTSSNGGNIISGASTATPTVNTAGTYTLKITNTSTGCFASDVALVTFSGTLPNANAGPDKQLNCSLTSLQLSGSSSSTGVTYSWNASNGGNILSGANTATPTVNAAGTYTLTVTKTSGGCTKTDVALVTMNTSLPSVNAGIDLALSCDTPSLRLNGSSTTPNAIYSWTAGFIGHIVSGANQNNPLVDAAGFYTLTVTDPSNGCQASDIAEVDNGCILLYYPDDTIGKVNNKIGSELTSLFKNFNPYAADTTKNIFRLSNDSVWIEVIARAGKRDSVAQLLTTLPYGIMTDTINNGGSLIISGKFPISKLGQLNNLPDRLISYVRPLYSPSVLAIGLASKGDSAIRANVARKGFNLKGSGIKVGLISDSYNTLNKADWDIKNGDLPGGTNPNQNFTPVTVLKECSFPSVDEGRAMAQVVYDVAPEANLNFRTGYTSATDFAVGIKELQQAGCNVIVDDVTYITEPFFTDGVVARAVDQVASLGVSYFTAAGNFGGKSYQGTFNPAPPPAGKSGFAHNFGGGDILQKIAFNGKGDYTIVLQWEDGIYSDGALLGTANDLDIYLTDANGKILVGYNRNNLSADPIEVLPISVPTASAIANIMIVRAAGTSNVKFKYVVFRGDVTILEYKSDSSTIVGQANANGAIAVAAMRYNKSNQTENFTSIGGTTVNGSVRNKPDITSPDGVNTTVNFGSPDLELDLIPNFFGTSAAAPHAAASAALVLEAKMKYYSQSISASGMKTLLQSTARDVDAPGFDFSSGAGLVQTDAAIRTFASPKPVLSSLNIPAGVTPGTQVFTATVNGAYMNAQSKVYLKGVQLPTTFVNANQMTASIPLFNGNPPLTVFNPPTVPNLNDGGFSDSLYFTPLKKVVITADNKTKKYGEKIPAFTVTVTVDGQPLSSTGLTLADLKLTALSFTTSATKLSDAITIPYYIHPSFTTPLNPANAGDSILLAKYAYTFVDGGLSIQRLPLTISSRDTSLVYGQKIDGQGLKYNYVYDKTNIDPIDQATFLNSIETEHEQNITGAVALADERIASGLTGRVITNSDLVNLSLAASGGAISNGRVITNGVGNSTTLIDISPQSIFDFVDHPDTVSLISGYAGENSRTLINGRVITNGLTGRVITNGLTGRVITNGLTGRVITNSTSGVNSNTKLALLVDSVDLKDTILNEIKGIKSINLITGTTVGSWRMVPAAYVSDNFDISYGIGTLTITKAPLTITADNKSRFYGSANPTLTMSYSGFVNGDTPASIVAPVISTTATTSSVAGSYVIKVNGGSAVNYTLTKVYGTLTVKKVVLTVTADNKTRTYGSSNPTFTFTYSGFVNGEGTDSLLTLPTASSLATQLSNAGNYAIKVSGGTARSYSFNYVSGTLSITKAVLTATADNKSKSYGSSNPAFTLSYSGFLNGDGVSNITAPSVSSPATKLSGVGTYAITPSGGNATNYSFVLAPGTLTITPASLLVTADNKTIIAGASLPTFSYTTIGFVTGGANSISSGPSYTVNPVYSGAVGNYSIVPAALVLSQPANYSITYAPGVLLVTTSNASTQHIEVELECVDTLINDISGFHYLARFEYENDNCYTVTVPVGADNSLTGNFSGTQPSTFLPGENHFTIKFDGNQLTWAVKSYEGLNKQTSTASGNKNSRSCHCTSTRLAQAGTLSIEQSSASMELNLYPNPASDMVYITSSTAFNTESNILVYDLLGKEQIVRTVFNAGNTGVALNVSTLERGVYFIKINALGDHPIMRFIKE